MALSRDNFRWNCRCCWDPIATFHCIQSWWDLLIKHADQTQCTTYLNHVQRVKSHSMCIRAVLFTLETMRSPYNPSHHASPGHPRSFSQPPQEQIRASNSSRGPRGKRATPGEIARHISRQQVPHTKQPSNYRPLKQSSNNGYWTCWWEILQTLQDFWTDHFNHEHPFCLP